jgi:hypothetical protein
MEDFKRESSAALQPHRIPSEPEPEPLLTLITDNIPCLRGPVNTSINAIDMARYYSPNFVQQLIARPVGVVASSVGMVSQRSGIDGRVRQYFGDTPESRRSVRDARLESEHAMRRKRPREPSPDAPDLEKGLISSPTDSRQRSRSASSVTAAEPLPAYDENRSPPYEKLSQLAVQDGQRNWTSKLIITTSGLGVALSDTSLRSLKYCLSVLQLAFDRLINIMATLRQLLKDFQETMFASRSESPLRLTPEQEKASLQAAESIKKQASDIMQTLTWLTDNVSHYAGGALPDNVGALVRRQLLSLPQRWQFAQQAADTDSAVASSAAGNSDVQRTGQRWIVFAEQACDMTLQVMYALKGTVQSAENWLGRMGRRRPGGPMSPDGSEPAKRGGSSGMMSPTSDMPSPLIGMMSPTTTIKLEKF